MSNTIIIGAGAAGTVAAIYASRYGRSVTMFEPNDKIGRKLCITGKGMCNITNNSSTEMHIKNIPTNPHFMYSAFSIFGAKETMNFFEELGVPLKTMEGGRVFPVSNKSEDIVNALSIELRKQLNVEIVHKRVQSLIIKDCRCFGVIAGDKEYYSETSLIACGGKSYPVTGSTGDGYKLAKNAGHTVIKLKPGLIPLISPDKFCVNLMGLSLRNVTLRLIDGEKIIYSKLGKMLFTHFGVSGPLVLSASSHIRTMEPNRYKFLIDLKPGLDIKQLDNRIQRDFAEHQNCNFVNGIRKLLPALLIPVIATLSGIDPNKKINSITKTERHKFGKLIKSFPIRISGFRPINEAIITRGGVSVKEIDPRTMESKKCKGLFFAGEVIDVDAYTGGFNLQIAFSTAYAAALNL